MQRLSAIHHDLLAWFDRAKRDLPWRRTRDPYAIWLSEVMLQQTRVETVVPYYQRFLAEFPTLGALAEAPLDRVMGLWSGLGYYRRARMLHEGARALARRGSFPRTAEELREIHGIGPYTAGAVASIAWGEPAALVDGNVARVLARLFAVTADVRGGRGKARVWSIALELVPSERPGDWNQALMELGATICTPRAPGCVLCPVVGHCKARAAGQEAKLPRLAPRAQKALVEQTAMVAVRGEAVLLARRRPDGLFGGLWEPPVFDATEADPASSLRRNFGVRVTRIEERGSVTRVLTHRRITTRVLRGELQGAPRRQETRTYDAARLVPLADLAPLGVSTLARKVLAKAR